MADDERRTPDDAESSLELPSLRSAFGRRRPGTAESAESDAEIAPSRHVTTRRQEPGLPIPGWLAAMLTGAVVGLVLVGLTAGSLHLCSAMRGTSSCGKPGIVLLLAITAVAILLGSVLLRLAGVAAHGSTSFLGTGLVVVAVLLALLSVLDEWWVVIVVPGLAMVGFVAGWWLTSTYSEPGERPH